MRLCGRLRGRNGVTPSMRFSLPPGLAHGLSFIRRCAAAGLVVGLSALTISHTAAETAGAAGVASAAGSASAPARAPAASTGRETGSEYTTHLAAELAAARAATDRRDFSTALPLFERLVRRAPQDADLLIEAARVFGWADHNARAAALYLQALSAAPARRADIVPSLAWQTLWAGDTRAALPWFEEAARLRPGEREIGWAWAQALNDNGHHREAIALFRRWSPPLNEGERLDLARALRWAGYEDRAWPLVREARGAEAAWLRDHRFARDVAPHAHASLERAEDRDGLRSVAGALGAGLAPWAGVNLELGARRLELTEGALSAQANSFELAARARLGEPDAASGSWWPTLIVRTHRIGDWQPLTSTLRLKWIPADRWRLDAEHTRELIETPRAFANRVSVDVSSVGADWRHDSRLTLAGAVARLRFDDGTTRRRLVARSEWVLSTRPHYAVGAEWSGFERTADGRPGSADRGYWNPRSYQEGRLIASAGWDRRPWEMRARLGLARSREVDAQGIASRGAPHLWELAAAVDTAPSWRLHAAVGGSGQGLGLSGAGTSGAGYWRRWAHVGVHAWFP